VAIQTRNLLFSSQVAVVGLLIALHVTVYWPLEWLLDISGYATLPGPSGGTVDARDLAGLLRDALGAGQAGMLALWAILGPWKWWIRLPLVVASCWVLWTADPVNVSLGVSNPLRQNTLTAEAVTVGALAAIWRLKGWRIGNFPSFQPSRRMKLPLWTLLAGTALAAVGVRGAQLARAQSIAADQPDPGLVAISVGCVLGLAVLLAAWNVLVRGRIWPWVFPVLLVSAAMGLLPAYVGGLTLEGELEMILPVWTAATSMVVLCTLAVVRWTGSLLDREEPIRTQTEASKP
jgi:hypothetical protein